ncbi:MAG: hypothetical protein IKU60_01025 [Clostridia bacterium]|nr:hypothetical protein [Clostridia bacterium]
MKRIISFFIAVCIFTANLTFAYSEEVTSGTVYLFGDDWAVNWGESLGGFIYDSSRFVNGAKEGDLISLLQKTSEFSSIKKGDVVILSYGILEKDRPSDKNAQFRKSLEDVLAIIDKKGAKAVYASVCSTMRFNTLTGQMAETKNFYTETAKSVAKARGITYIDLAALTAKMASKAGSSGAGTVYKSMLSLTDAANNMCAYEVFKYLSEIESIRDNLKVNLSRSFDVAYGETGKTIDVSLEDEITDTYALYFRNGENIRLSEEYIYDGKAYITKSVNGKINVSFTSCEKIQITPVYVFNTGGWATTDNAYKAQALPGLYDVTVRKTEPLKASVYLDGYLIASNLDMPGTQAVPEAAIHTFDEYHFKGGEFAVTVKGLTDKLDFIMLREPNKIQDDKIRIFVGGDSTVCNYYPLLRTGQEMDGTVMTGWGMFLEKYIDARVMNLAASGDWAENWLKASFPIVEKEGEKGDIFIVQFGINDHDKSTVEKMTAALGEMIDRCEKKGIIPILVSPQISAGYGWGDESNVGKSDGGAYVEFFDAVRSLASGKGCFYVDLTDMSSGWFSEVGREEVYKMYHLWDYEKNAPKDMMHLSARGAESMCRFFVLAIQKLIDARVTDKCGNTLEFLKIW